MLVAVALVGAALVVPRGGADADRASSPSDGGNGKAAMRAVKGDAAIARLGDDIRGVAWRHGWSVNELRHVLRDDPTSWLDQQDQVFYEEPAVEEAPATVLTEPTGVVYDTAGTFSLHSLPGATRTIYLDFDGHTTSGTSWNNGGTIVSAPFDTDGSPTTWSSSERSLIATVWRMVAEDYAPFQIDVTTEDPGAAALAKSSSTDTAYGVRVVVSPSNWYSSGAGGVAYVGSFSWSSDTPVFVFSQQLADNAKYIAEAASHEAGHAVGLSHDGIGSDSYHMGNNGWAPIMGVGYYQGVVQWSRGEYSLATNTQDDLAIIAGHAPARVDEAGSSAANAATITVPGVTEGVIASPGDIDTYVFTTSGGPVTITAAPAGRSPNLNLALEVRDGAGTRVALADPAGTAAASVTLELAAGTYALAIDGVGDPVPPYGDYGSVGYYRLTLATATSVTTTTTIAPPPPSTVTTTTTTTLAPTTTTAAPTTTTVQPSAKTVRVSSVTVRRGSTTLSVTADVVLVDSAGQVVPGATVTGAWSGQVKGTSSATTGATGVATMPEQRLRRSGTVGFTVRTVTLPSGYVWDGVTLSGSLRL